MELFVYYRLDAARAEDALSALTTAHETLRRNWPGLVCRVLQRDATGAPTWMETYARPDAVLRAQDCEALEAALADLPPGRIGPRHGECFSLVACTALPGSAPTH